MIKTKLLNFFSLNKKAQYNASFQEYDQDELLYNISSLKKIFASNIMQPRSNIIAVSNSNTIDECIKIMSDNNIQLLPVYRNNLDDIFGFVEINDLLPLFISHEDKNKEIKPYIKRLLFISPTMTLFDIIVSMVKYKTKIAIVIDEYGGIDGAIYYNKIINYIICDVDEREESKIFSWDKQNKVIIMDARTDIEEVEKIIGNIFEDQHKEKSDTIGGLVYSLIERIPNKNEIIDYNESLSLEIIDVDAKQMHIIKLTYN